jgi:hypothetical protein
MSDEPESCNQNPVAPKKRGRRRFIDPVEHDPHKECEPIFKRDRGRFEPHAERRVKDRNRQAKAERIARARDLFLSGVNKTRIAEEIGVSRETIVRWLAGVNPPAKGTEQVDVFEDNLFAVVEDTVADARIAAREEEDRNLLDVAESQATPADKYQAYVAASAMKILRDNLLNIRGPRTIREMSELDQLIRRNLGLNAKSGGGSSSLTIDISVLNNSKAATGGAQVVVEAEEVDED